MYSARKNTRERHARILDVEAGHDFATRPRPRRTGARLVSASPTMKYTRNSGNSGIKYQRSSRRAFLAARRCRRGSCCCAPSARRPARSPSRSRRRRSAPPSAGAEERVLRVRRPARDDDAVHAHRRHREDVEQRPRRCSDEHPAGRRTESRPRGERGRHRQHRRDEEQDLVGARGDDDLLDQQLEHVGERLQQALPAHAIRARCAPASSRSPCARPA